MKDFLERMEDAAEKRLSEQTKDCPEDHFKCGCGTIEHFDNAYPYSSDPFSEPICSDCFEKWREEREGK